MKILKNVLCIFLMSCAMLSLTSCYFKEETTKVETRQVVMSFGGGTESNSDITKNINSVLQAHPEYKIVLIDNELQSDLVSCIYVVFEYEVETK